MYSNRLVSNFLLTIIISQWYGWVECGGFSPGSFILNKPECSAKRMQDIDSYIIRFVSIGRGGREFPTNRTEVHSFCKESDRITEEIDQYLTDCFPNEERSAAKIFIYSARRSLKTICTKKSTKKQRKFLEIAPCINRANKNINCIDIYSNNTRSLIPYDIGMDKLKYICCYYLDLMNCFERTLSKLSCMNSEGQEFFADWIGSITGDIINFGCGDYNASNDRCDSLQPLEHSKRNRSIQLNNNIRSFFFSIVFALESIGKHVVPL